MSDSPNSAPEQPKKKRNFLIIYVISLLAIALLLLLFSFLQSRRASEQITDLQNQHDLFSTSALQSISDLNERLGELEEHNELLQGELSTLSDTNSRLTSENESLRRELSEAKDDLAAKRLEMFDEREYRKSLEGIFEQMETDGVAELIRDADGKITGISIEG